MSWRASFSFLFLAFRSLLGRARFTVSVFHPQAPRCASTARPHPALAAAEGWWALLPTSRLTRGRRTWTRFLLLHPVGEFYLPLLCLPRNGFSSSSSLIFSRFFPVCAADLSLRSVTGSRVRSPLEIFFLSCPHWTWFGFDAIHGCWTARSYLVSLLSR
jgi:hypothetical protein